MNNDISHIPDDPAQGQRVLQNLAGVWEGRGEAFFPSIANFEYRERFELRWDRDVFIYEQSTDKREQGKVDWEPGHREYGFIHLFPERIEMNNCQNGGRVEWLSGFWKLVNDVFECEVDAQGFGNDPRMLRSKRKFQFQAERLHYDLFMATGACPQLIHHLSSTMLRVG